MTEAFPLWVLVVDYIMGVIMWTLIGRFGMSLFLREDTPFFFARFFIRVTNPLLHLLWPDYTEVSDPPADPALYRLVFLYDPLLSYALAPGLHGHGDALFSTGERVCRRA